MDDEYEPKYCEVLDFLEQNPGDNSETTEFSTPAEGSAGNRKRKTISDIGNSTSSPKVPKRLPGVTPRVNLLFSKYFNDAFRTEKGISGKCRSCTKLISGYGNSTSNFITHLKTCSAELFAEYSNEKSGLSKNSASGYRNVGEDHSIVDNEPNTCSSESYSTIRSTEHLASPSNWVNKREPVHVESYINNEPASSSAHSTRFAGNPIISSIATNKRDVESIAVNKSAQITLSELNDAITEFIVEDLQPFRRVESRAFRNLVAVCLGYDSYTKPTDFSFSFINRHMVAQKIETLHSHQEKWLKMTFSSHTWICLTVDIWSCKNRSFLTVNGHFTDDKSLERRSYVLCCEYLPTSYTNETIAERFQLLCSRYDIKQSNIVSTITDCGNNLKKPLREFEQQFRNHPSEHDSNTARRESSEVDEGSHDEDEIETLLQTLNTTKAGTITGEVHRDKLAKLSQSRIKNVEVNDEVTVSFTNHEKCPAHQLNLVCLVDSLAAIKNPTYKKLYEGAFEKLEMLWKCCGKPKSNEIMSKHLGWILDRPTKTKWSSILDKITEILGIAKAKLDQTMTKLAIPALTQQQHWILDEYVVVLKPLAAAVENLQRRQCPYAVVLPTLYSTYAKLQKISADGHLSVCQPLHDAVIHGFEKRFHTIMDLNSPKAAPAVIATVCHPHFKLRWLATNERTPEEVDNILNIIIRAADQISMENWQRNLENRQHIESASTFSDQVSHRKGGGAQESTIFAYKFYDDDDDAVDDNDPLGSIPNFAQEHIRNQSEILSYIKYGVESDIDNLEQLKTFPVVRQLYRKFNASLPSGADLERFFSYAGMVVGTHESHVESGICEKIIALKTNYFCDAEVKKQIESMEKRCVSSFDASGDSL